MFRMRNNLHTFSDFMISPQVACISSILYGKLAMMRSFCFEFLINLKIVLLYSESFLNSGCSLNVRLAAHRFVLDEVFQSQNSYCLYLYAWLGKRQSPTPKIILNIHLVVGLQ